MAKTGFILVSYTLNDLITHCYKIGFKYSKNSLLFEDSASMNKIERYLETFTHMDSVKHVLVRGYDTEYYAHVWHLDKLHGQLLHLS